MELWEKVKAAKEAAEAKYPIESHIPSWEERDMAIFATMVQAVTGEWEPPAKEEEAPPAEEPPVTIPTPKPEGE